jgi:peptidoglycan L-alanyl-D-glutamate endopeptidase CwlK
MSNRVEDLEPVTRAKCEAFLTACTQQGLAVRITHTFRTMDEQQHLWMQGRLLPGPIVTNAKAGSSAHNWRKAFDVCFNGATLAECYPPHSDVRWTRVGEIGEGLGLAWGGRWNTIKDLPHFEDPNWKSAIGVPA